MGISQLPKIEIPDEETLDDEDQHFLDALKMIHKRFRHSQTRLRAISKAYVKLESIALSLVKDGNEINKRSPSKSETTGLPVKRGERKLLPLQLHGNDSRDNISMVDLTCDFEQPIDTPVRETSPIFGQNRRRSKKQNVGTEETDTSEDFKENIEKSVVDSWKKKDTNQVEKSLDKETAEGNEENSEAICKNIFKSPKSTCNDSTLYLKESSPLRKIGFTKTVYNIDRHKTPSGKRSKQCTLVFQRQTAKIDISCSEKESEKASQASRKCNNLFDENYRNTNKSSGEKYVEEKKQESLEIGVKVIGEKKSDKATLILSDLGENLQETPVKPKEMTFVIDTPSQIDETARSLFDDEDLDDFDCSKDLLNTCMDSPPIDNAIQPVTPNIIGNNNRNNNNNNDTQAIASTSKISSQPFHAVDSIDETFFAPVEIEIAKRDVGKIEKATSKPGCSAAAAAAANKSSAKNRNLKRKNSDDTEVEAAKDLRDFGVHDIDWDQDISNDNWPPPKRSLNNSFDILPEKKKKSPNFAYKEKVERNQAERAKLGGWDCKDCEMYYGNMNLPEEELKKYMNRCSRHRSKYNQRYFTPKGFWNPVFPDATDSSDFSEDEQHDKSK